MGTKWYRVVITWRDGDVAEKHKMKTIIECDGDLVLNIVNNLPLYEVEVVEIMEIGNSKGVIIE